MKFKRTRLNNMAPTKEIKRIQLSKSQIENKINEKLDEAISRLNTVRSYLTMLKDYETIEKLEDIILELDNIG